MNFICFFVWLKPINVSWSREEDVLCDTCWKLSTGCDLMAHDFVIRRLSEILRSVCSIYYLERWYLFTNLQFLFFVCLLYLQSFPGQYSLRNRRCIKKLDLRALNTLEDRSLNFATNFCQIAHKRERNSVVF